MSANRVAAINPLSMIRTRYGNSASTPGATQTGKNKQNSLQKGSRYGISVSTPHRRYGHRLRTPLLWTPFPRLLKNFSRPQKGPAERGHVKKRSKIVKKCQKYFRHFSTFFAQSKKRQKSTKSDKNIFRHFSTFFAQGKKRSKINKKRQTIFRHFSRGTSLPGPSGGL